MPQQWLDSDAMSNGEWRAPVTFPPRALKVNWLDGAPEVKSFTQNLIFEAEWFAHIC
jgi:hypothetical protein